MGYHGFRDSWFCSLSSLRRTLGGKRFFSRSIESPTLSELYDGLSVSVPAFDKVGSYPVTVAGDDSLRPVVHVLSWKGEGYPAVIYHHISGEFPVDASCRKILLSPKHPL
ncbi:MAG TPA: hypothetical protein VF857_00440, partial [Spirochaetota bacterium]